MAENTESQKPNLSGLRAAGKHISPEEKKASPSDVESALIALGGIKVGEPMPPPAGKKIDLSSIEGAIEVFAREHPSA